jgi:hypothetical protein
MMLQPEPLFAPTSQIVLVVEGKDEEYFFEALLRHERIQDAQVLPIGGKDRLAENLKALRNARQFRFVRSLGVVRDADADPKGTYSSVRDALQRAKLPTPDAHAQLVEGPPRVSVFIIPSALQRGALEDLCLAAVEDDPAYPCVEKYFECLEQASVGCSSEQSRARMQVFLASRKKVDKRLGVAAQAGYIPWGSPVFEELKRFLHALAR